MYPGKRTCTTRVALAVTLEVAPQCLAHEDRQHLPGDALALEAARGGGGGGGGGGRSGSISVFSPPLRPASRSALSNTRRAARALDEAPQAGNKGANGVARQRRG